MEVGWVQFDTAFLWVLQLDTPERDRWGIPPGALRSAEDVSRALEDADGWQRRGEGLGPEAAAYFHRAALSALTKREVWQAGEAFTRQRLSIEGREGGEKRPWGELQHVRLHLFDAGALTLLVLELRVSGRLPQDCVLELHETLRHTAPMYQSQALDARQLHIGERCFGWRESVDARAWTAEWLDELLEPLRRHGEYRVSPAIESRMLVHAWVATHDPVRDDLWLPLLFCDPPGGRTFHAGPELEQAIRDHHEYRRWWSEQRIGFTRYSAAFLGSASSHFFTRHVREHVHGVYLLVALRAVLRRAYALHVQQRVSELADQAADLSRQPKRTSVDDLSDRAQTILADLLAFEGWYSLVEAGHQDQGIDMMRQWDEVMRTPDMLMEQRDFLVAFESFLSQRAAVRLESKVQSGAWMLAGAAFFVGLLGADWEAMQALPGGRLGGAACSLLVSVALMLLLRWFAEGVRPSWIIPERLRSRWWS